jgi:sugar lactone lactonase YvrE
MGRVYTADFGSSLGGGGTPGVRIHRVDPETGEVSVFAEGFQGASGNAIGPDGMLYQSNIGGNVISRVTPEGLVTEFATGLNNPVGIAVAPDGTLSVANCGNGSIARVDEQGQVTPFVSSDLLKCPNGLEGELTLIAGTGERGRGDGPALEGTLSLPNDLGLSPDGTRLYFNDVAAEAGDPSNLSPVYVRVLELGN